MGDRLEIGIIHGSRWGAGLKCCSYLKEKFSSLGHDVKVTSVSETDPKTYTLPDILIISTPVYMSFSRMKVRRAAKAIAARGGGRAFAVLQTGGTEKIQRDRISLIMERQGWKRATPTIKILVSEKEKGELRPGWEEKISEFVDSVLSSKGK